MANFERWPLPLPAMLTFIMILTAASQARAFPSGVSTLSFGPQGCNQCHTGGMTPTVTLTGPTTVDPNSTNEYTLQITSVGTQTFGGFNVAADLATLSTGGSATAQTQATTGTGERTEITHIGAKPASGGMTTFSFLWTAPGSFTSATLSAWGNAVNGNGLSSGDRAAAASLTVSSSMPGPNPTATPTSTPVPTPTPVLHDVVVAPVKPLKLSIAAGGAAVTKQVNVKVTNADPKTQPQGQNVQLTVTSDCPTGVTIGMPDFGGSPFVFLTAGKAKAGKVAVTISSDAFTTLNHTAASRCTLMFSAGTAPPSLDPDPSNNTVTAEVNVTDKNDADQATVDESFVQSITPVKLTIPPLGASSVKTVKPAVGNADILPAQENPGDQITITANDGDCPAGTVGAVSPGQVTVKGGKKQSVAFTVSVDAANFTTTSAKSPARCTAEVTATGPADPDPDPTNNTTKVVIDVIDKNDF